MTRVEAMKGLLCIGLVLSLCFSPSMTRETSSVDDVVRMHLKSSPVEVTREIASVPPVSRASKGIVRLFEITCYSPTIEETDGNPLRTASGKQVRVGGIAADLRVLPFGSLVIIPNYNDGKPCEVIDTGGAIKGYKLDVFLWKTEDAIKWGRRKNVPVTIVRLGLEEKQ